MKGFLRGVWGVVRSPCPKQMEIIGKNTEAAVLCFLKLFLRGFLPGLWLFFLSRRFPVLIGKPEVLCQLYGGFFLSQPIQGGGKINHIPIRTAAEAVVTPIQLHAWGFIVMERATSHPVPAYTDSIINNRLLCELATHKDFIKFLADIEIYVDGIATMQIQNLNSLVDTVRHEIIERYRPGEDDPHLKVLQAAHISDDEYFSHMVRDDLNLIIRDIREAHKKDSESAPQTTVANELKENLEAVENFKGSRDEKLVILYCKQLGINYKNLSEEEFRWFIRILKKSKKMGTPISQRKKR